MKKTGRNESCPCGSGKKYKRCCLPKSYIPAGKEDSIKDNLVREIQKFIGKRFSDYVEDAFNFFWGDFDLGKYIDEGYYEYADINFHEWLVHDWVPCEDGKTIVDHFINNNLRLTADELKILNMMNKSVISLYEIQEVFPGNGFILKDLLMGGEYDVMEKLASTTLRKWDIFATRLMILDGKFIMSGCIYPYPLMEKESIINYIKEEFEDFKEDYKDAVMDDFLKSEGDIFNFLWCDTIINMPKMDIVTKDGEPLIFTKAVFEIKDRDAVVDRLKKVKGFKPENNGYVWLSKLNKDESGSVQGNISITDNELILECTTEKQHKKGKSLLIKHLSDLIIHKTDSFQEPHEAIASMKDTHPHDIEDIGSKVPMEIQKKLYTEFMQKHYEKWFTDKLPALNGQTPLEAVKTEEGKLKVIDLLKWLENSEERNKREGRPFFDIAWMWDRLNLIREV